MASTGEFFFCIRSEPELKNIWQPNIWHVQREIRTRVYVYIYIYTSLLLFIYRPIAGKNTAEYIPIIREMERGKNADGTFVSGEGL